MNAPHGPSEQELVAQTLKTAPGMSWDVFGCGNHGGNIIGNTMEQTLAERRLAYCGAIYFEFSRLSAMTPMFIDLFVRW